VNATNNILQPTIATAQYALRTYATLEKPPSCRESADNRAVSGEIPEEPVVSRKTGPSQTVVALHWTLHWNCVLTFSQEPCSRSA